MSAPGPIPVIIIGGGGHARVLADALLASGRIVLGFTALERQPDLAPGIPWLGDDTALDGQDPTRVELVNGIGSTYTTLARQGIFERLTQQGFRAAHVTHPTAITSSLDVRIGQGCQRLAGSTLGPNVQLGDNVLINSRAVVEHDCQVGDHSHVATGAILCGGCVIGTGAHVGAGATVIQGMHVGNGAIVAAGSVVTKNVEPLTLVAGVPARPKRALDE